VWTESGAHRITDAIEFLMLSVGEVPEIERGRGEAFALQPSGNASGGLHLVPIADVERFQHLGDVYSLETRPSHTFAATHGIVVHNCIPVDPQYLAWRVRGAMGHQFRMLEVAQDINERMPAYVSQRCAEVLNEHGKAVRGAKVLLLGMAYKGGAADTRESPALRVAARLQRMGAEIAYHDPFVSRVEVDGIERDSVSLSKDLVHLFDIVVILTDHPDVDYDAIVRDGRIVYDTRNATAGLDGPNVHRA
jgi:UDP-N-acetyl-D-mannosaminuronate dehydrogenase